MNNGQNILQELLAKANQELLPTQEKDRTLKTRDLLVLCSSMVINVVGLVIPAQVLLRGGYSPIEVLIACFFGFLLVTVLITLTGDIGTRYGVPFTIFIRDCLGKQGAKIGAICRAIVCLTWCGVILFLGTQAINAIIEIVTGVSMFWVIFITYASLQLFNASRNVDSMSKFGTLAVPILACGLVSLVAWLLQEHQISLPDIVTASPLEGTGFSFITVIAIFSGGWLSEALNGSDLTRKLKLPENSASSSFFARNKRTIFCFGLGFVGTGLLLTLAGLISAYLTKSDNPIGMLQIAFADNATILIISCIIIVFAQWTVNTCANIFPATLIMLNFFPKLTFAKATWLVGLISILMMPWLLLSYLDYVQMIFSAILAPILAIMLVHYYLIRKCHLNLENLYSDDIPNWRKPGITALVIGLVSGMIGYNFAFFIAFPITAIIYYLLAKKANI